MPLSICTKITTQTRATAAVLPCPLSWGDTTSADMDWDRRWWSLQALRHTVRCAACKKVSKKILGDVVKTGMEVVGDVVSGKNAKEAMKERGLAGIKRTIGDIARQSPSDSDRVDVTAPTPKRAKQPTAKKEEGKEESRRETELEK